jgi:general secretion pathway protein I
MPVLKTNPPGHVAGIFRNPGRNEPVMRRIHLPLLPPKSGGGFTLLEVIVAMAIMATVLVSVYRLYSQSLSMTMVSRFYIQAPQLAQQKLAELETASFKNTVQDSGDFGENFPGYTWQVAVEGIDSEMLGEVSQDLKRIDLTVAYHQNEFTYQVRTYRFVR